MIAGKVSTQSPKGIGREKPIKPIKAPGPIDLEDGQIWQTDKGMVVIIRLGKILVDYKLFRKGHRPLGIKTQTQSQKELLKVLRKNGARLAESVK